MVILITLLFQMVALFHLPYLYDISKSYLFYFTAYHSSKDSNDETENCRHSSIEGLEQAVIDLFSKIVLLMY